MRRAKDAPRRIKASGTVIVPKKSATKKLEWCSLSQTKSVRMNIPVSIMNARGGRPSGPFQAGPPKLDTSTNRALSGWMSAIGKAISRAIVTGFITAKMG